MPVLEEAQEVWGIRTVYAWEFTAVRIIRETTGRRNACVSSSCSFYDELCRTWLAGFKWRPREKVT